MPDYQADAEEIHNRMLKSSNPAVVAVAELHKPDAWEGRYKPVDCWHCGGDWPVQYPCPTVQAVEPFTTEKKVT